VRWLIAVLVLAEVAVWLWLRPRAG
jgi:hypothetical protein